MEYARYVRPLVVCSALFFLPMAVAAQRGGGGNNAIGPAGVLTPDTSPDGPRAAAADLFALVPAVGRSGNTVPLQTFAELLSGIGRDGSRAHALQQACRP